MITEEEEEMEVGSRGRCDVAVQWERLEGHSQEVAVQIQTQSSDVAVQVDLIGPSLAKPGSGDVPWRCVSVRAEDEPAGGALWLCCLHSPPLAASAHLLCPSPTEAPPENTVETTLPSMQHLSPSPSRTNVNNLPICGDSPSSAPDTTAHSTHDPAHKDPDSALKDLKPAPENMDFTLKDPDSTHKDPGLAPSDTNPTSEDSNPASSNTNLAPSDSNPSPLYSNSAPSESAPSNSNPGPSDSNPAPSDSIPAPEGSNPAPEDSNPAPEDLPEALGFMAPLSSDEEALSGPDELLSEAIAPVRRKRGHPKKVSKAERGRRRDGNTRQAGLPLRYQLDYDLDSANKKPESDEGAGPHRKDERKVLFLPYYRQTLDLGQFDQFQKIARRQFKALQKHAEHELMTEPSIMGEHHTHRSHSPDESSDKPPLMPLKLKKKTRVWSMERAKGENSGLSSSDRPEDQNQTEGESQKALAWSKCKRFVTNQEVKDRTGLNQSKAQLRKFPDSNAITAKGGEKVKRKPGRPRKKVVLKQEEVKIEMELEDFAMVTDNERPSSAEHWDRPRRKTVGPPLRYLLESESDTAVKSVKTERLDEDDEQGAVPDWFKVIKKEEPEDGDYHGTEMSNKNGLKAGVTGWDKLKLEDVRSCGEEKGALVKKVKILNDFEDVRTLFTLQGTEDAGEVPRNTENMLQEASGARRKMKGRRKLQRANEERPHGGGRGQKSHAGARWHSQKQTGFLVYRDEETGRSMFITPCYVKLQQVKDNEEREEAATTELTV